MYLLLLFVPYSYKELEGVVVVGATNFPESLDKYVSYNCDCNTTHLNHDLIIVFIGH